MSGQGHQIFVGELARFAAETADPRWTAIAGRVAAPLRVAVCGRRGVGRSTVAHALAGAGGRIEVTPSLEAADLGAYVITEVVKPEDRDAVAAARVPVVMVLNKADLIGPSPASGWGPRYAGAYPHPLGAYPQSSAVAGGPIAAAKTRCDSLCALTGVATEPMVGLLAVAALNDLLDDTLWAGLRVLAAQPVGMGSVDSFAAVTHPVATEVRLRLLDTLDVFGITQAVAAIRQGSPVAEVRAMLRRVSGVDAVVERIAAIGAEVYYRRMLDAVAELETLAVSDRRAGEFLSRDDTAIARMAAAVDVVEVAGLEVDRCDSRAAHLRRARGWQRYSRGPVAAVHRACGADIARGSLRLWSQAGRFGEGP